MWAPPASRESCLTSLSSGAELERLGVVRPVRVRLHEHVLVAGLGAGQALDGLRHCRGAMCVQAKGRAILERRVRLTAALPRAKPSSEFSVANGKHLSSATMFSAADKTVQHAERAAHASAHDRMSCQRTR